MPEVHLVLLHDPVVNRKGERVVSSVTNLDLHDISRSSKTFGISTYWLVTPIQEQHGIVRRILDHWHQNRSWVYHPDRAGALSLCRLVHNFSEIKAAIQAERPGAQIHVVLTDARPQSEKSIGYADLKAKIAASADLDDVWIIVFGTAWGVAPEFHSEVTWILDPIYGPGGPSGYNHLSVRAAVAIILDRLFGLH